MNSRTTVIRKLLPSLVLPSLMTVLGLYILIVSFNYQFESRAFAHVTGLAMTILSIAVIVRDTMRWRREAPQPAESQQEKATRRIHPLVTALAWCILFLAGVLLVGFVITTPIWVVCLLLWNRASRLATILIPILLWALLKFVLEYGLGASLFQGILFGEHLRRFW
jgi:L-asparagine transporter-like permease